MFNLKKSILTIALAGTILASSSINAGIWNTLKAKAKEKKEQALSFFTPSHDEDHKESGVVNSMDEFDEKVPTQLTDAEIKAKRIQYRAFAFAATGFTASKLLRLSWTKSALLGAIAGFIGYTYRNAQIKATLNKYYEMAKAKINKFLKREELVTIVKDLGLDMAKPTPPCASTPSEHIDKTTAPSIPAEAK